MVSSMPRTLGSGRSNHCSRDHEQQGMVVPKVMKRSWNPAGATGRSKDVRTMYHLDSVGVPSRTARC